MLPRKRKPTRSGIERAPQREFPRHRKFIRSHQCCVPGCEDGPIEVAHVRHADNAGTGIKPADFHAVSLCCAHHSEQHRVGALTFQKRHGIDLDKLAAEFGRLSPDLAMKQVMQAAA